MAAWLTARLRSFAYAFAGLVFMLRSQGNAQAHLAATMAVIVIGLYLQVGRGDWLWLIAAMGLVWITEAINTAIEHLCNVMSPGRNEDVRRAKDVAAGAVLAAAIAAALIGLAVFLPYL